MANQNTLLRLLKLIALLKQEPPKSIQSIADFLDTSTRTAYRYIELLEDVGFNTVIDKFKKYSIQDNQLLSPSNFNREELSFLKTLLLTSGQQNPLSQTIVHKLNLNSDIEHANQDIYNARIALHVRLINQSITENLQIILKQYESINTQKVSDRLVEPIKFTKNYKSLCAYEMESQSNKFFNLERIGEVVLTENPQASEDQHRYTKPDVFGFSKSKNKTTYHVKLRLNLKAKLLLTEEYPYTKPFVNPTKDNNYIFEAVIYNDKPLKRFYKGLQNDIDILPETTIKL